MFEQERVITRLQQAVLRELTVRVCFLTGSFGRRTEDAYSDLDVVLVFGTADLREQAYRKRQDFVQSILTYVPVKSFEATHLRPYLYVALFANGTKMDLRYEVQDELQPSEQDREIRILKDTDHWGEQFAAQSGRFTTTTATTPLVTAKQLEELDNQFWGLFWELFRLLKRGDYAKPFPTYLELVHQIIPPFLRWLPAGDPAYQGLIALYYQKDTQQTLTHLQQLGEAYLAARSAVVRQHRLMFLPNSAFENNILQLIRRK